MEETLICEPRRSLSLPLDDIVEVMRRLNARLSRSGSVAQFDPQRQEAEDGPDENGCSSAFVDDYPASRSKSGGISISLGPGNRSSSLRRCNRTIQREFSRWLANPEEKSLPIQVSTKPPDRISLELSDSKGSSVCLELNKDQAFAVMESIAQGINALPRDPKVPLHLQRAVLNSRGPAFQVGIGGDGHVVLAIKPEPLPPMLFEFDAEALSKLISDLRKAANVPNHQAGSKN